MKNTYKAIFLPNRKVILDYYQGYVLDGEPLYGIKDSDVYSETEYYEIVDERSKLELAFRGLILIILFPLILILFIIQAILNKGDSFSDWTLNKLNNFVALIFNKKKITKKRKIKSKKYENSIIEDIPTFLIHCKNENFKVIIYSYQSLLPEELKKIDFLIENGKIDSFQVITKLSDLSTFIKFNDISVLSSALYITDISERNEAELLGFNTGNSGIRNVGLWFKTTPKNINHSNSIEVHGSKSIIEKQKAIRNILIAEKNAFLTNEMILFIEDTTDVFLNEYLAKNLNSINLRLEPKGFKLLHFPSFTSETLYNNRSILDFIRYRIPILYALNDDELEEILSALLQNLPAIDFYNIVLEELKLPYFEKPCLLRNIYGGAESSKNKFTYSPIKYNNDKDLNEYFNWYIDQVKIPNDFENTAYRVVGAPEEYDADWYFGKESKLDSDEIKQKIDDIKAEGKFGVLAEAIMYMLETIKEEKPEILSKIKPLIEQHKMLESKVILSPIYIDKHYNIFLPNFGNQEVKMHALPKAVYLLFLKHRNGIRFKELYQYKSELLDIYYKITNKDNKEEIEKAIDDLIDMTNPSINQKCSRIREAFRKIMDEHVAKYYYIDGANGEPKKINLPDNLIDIRY
jgi:hypothetical protein